MTDCSISYSSCQFGSVGGVGVDPPSEFSAFLEFCLESDLDNVFPCSDHILDRVSISPSLAPLLSSSPYWSVLSDRYSVDGEFLEFLRSE